jgi:hypothetical protein
MFKKVSLLVVFVFLFLSGIGAVSAVTGHFEFNSTVGQTTVVEKLPDSFGNPSFGSCNFDRVHAFERSGLFDEKTVINKHKERKFGKYEFTANKAGSVTVKIDYNNWDHPDYYTFNVKNK